MFGRTLRKIFDFFFFFLRHNKKVNLRTWHAFLINLCLREILNLRPSALSYKNMRSAAGKFAHSAVSGNTYAPHFVLSYFMSAKWFYTILQINSFCFLNQFRISSFFSKRYQNYFYRKCNIVCNWKRKLLRKILSKYGNSYVLLRVLKKSKESHNNRLSLK